MRRCRILARRLHRSGTERRTSFSPSSPISDIRDSRASRRASVTGSSAVPVRTMRSSLPSRLPSFDSTDTTAAIEDILLVYLVDPSEPGETLLDRGTPGTSLFMLAGDQVEFTPGLVYFDGKTVSIDVTSLGNLTEGHLKFQLGGSDDDTGPLVQIANIQSLVDPDGIAASWRDVTEDVERFHADIVFVWTYIRQT